MRIKDDNNLKELARISLLSESALSDRIIKIAFNEELIEAEREFYNTTMKEQLVNADKGAFEMLLSIVGSNNMSLESLALFGGLVFIGDGDCPDCGGDGELLQEGDPWYDENSHKCTVCETIY